jgi:DNA-binding PadR family transcriptional regulator
LIDYIILGFLLTCDLSGYDVKQKLQMSTAHFYDASFGSIYPALRRLEATGLITASERVDAGRYRKLFHLLAAGRLAFLQWLEQPLIIHPSRQEWLVRVFFYRHLPTATVLQLLADFQRLVTQHQDQLTVLEPHIEGKADFFQLSTLHFGTDYYQFLLTWLDNYIKQISATYPPLPGDN